MKIPKILFLTFFISVIAVLCFFALAPAFADMDKVDDAELAQTNASVTGASVKDRINCVEKDGICLETKLDHLASDTGAAVSSPTVMNVTESIGLSLKIDGKETFQFGIGGVSSHWVNGGITSVQSR